MKLIDVEEMIKSFEQYYEKNGYEPRELHFSLADMKMNFNEKEVQAIPIEWLEEVCRSFFRKWETENIQNGVPKGAEYALIAHLIQDLIELWRKANENNH